MIKILHETNAFIVLSSSHRLPYVDETKEYMMEKLLLPPSICDRLVGVTIRAYHYLDKSKKIHLSIPRGVEIKQWIDTNIHSDNGKNYKKKVLGKDYNYVILDDDTDMLLEQSIHFFHCDSEIGLNKEMAEKIIKHFKIFKP